MKKKLIVVLVEVLFSSVLFASEPSLSKESKIEILTLQRDVNYKAAILQQKMQEINYLKDEFDKINNELQSKIKSLKIEGYILNDMTLEYKKNVEDTKKQQDGK